MHETPQWRCGCSRTIDVDRSESSSTGPRSRRRPARPLDNDERTGSRQSRQKRRHALSRSAAAVVRAARTCPSAVPEREEVLRSQPQPAPLFAGDRRQEQIRRRKVPDDGHRDTGWRAETDPDAHGDARGDDDPSTADRRAGRVLIAGRSSAPLHSSSKVFAPARRLRRPARYTGSRVRNIGHEQPRCESSAA